METRGSARPDSIRAIVSCGMPVLVAKARCVSPADRLACRSIRDAMPIEWPPTGLAESTLMT